MKCDYLIKNGKILTMNGKEEVIEKGYIVIKDDEIIEMGEMENLKSKDLEVVKEEIDAFNQIIMPGFVNVHNHSFAVLSRYMSIPMKGVDPKDFGDVLTRWYWPKVEDSNSGKYTYYGSLLFATEALKRGVTCTADLLEGANVVENGIDKVGEAFRKVGLRGHLAFEASERVSREHGEKALQKNVDFAKKWNGKDDLIKGTLGVHTAFSASPEYIQQTRELADEINVPLQIHIAQSTYEVEFIKENMGYPGPVYLLEDKGFLGEDVIAAHCIYLEEEEIDLLAKNNVNISFNPKSNQNAANGVCPVNEFRQKGMNVGLGLDAINIMDMHEMMVHAAYMTRNNNLDRKLLPAKEVLKMATINGAKALGRENELGSLEKGKKADMIFVNLEGKTHLAPLFDVWEAAAFGARGTDVEMVMVDGNIVVENNKVKGVDTKELIKDVEKIAKEYKDTIINTPVKEEWKLSTL